MTLLAPMFALAALAAVPIVLLYLLKMKRQERVVSSTLLWQQTIRDLEANVPFQKLRANLLLILQMLILALVVLALMRPALPSTFRVGERSVLVIDTSASMLATDVDEGTRFDRAKKLARSLVDGLAQDGRMMILAGGRSVTDGFVASRALLRDAVDSLQASEAESDVGGTLQLAHSMLTAGEAGAGDAAGPGRILLVSDGAGLDLPKEPLDLGDYLTYFVVGTSGDNVGIVGLEFRRPADGSGRGQLFVAVGNFSDRDRPVMVSLRRRDSDQAIDAAEVVLRAGQSSGATFDREFPAGEYVCSVDVDDALPLDDRAFLVLGENRPLRAILVSEGNAVLERFLAAAPGVDAARVAPADFDAADETTDLFLFDRCAPLSVPQGRTIVFLAPTGPVSAFDPAGPLPSAQVFDWNRDDPVMRFVGMNDVRLADLSAVQLRANPRIVPLVWGQDATLVGYASAGAVRHYCVAFDVERSTWPGTPSFPIFMGNVIAEARRARRLGQALTEKTGRLWPLGHLAQGETVRVTDPAGRTVRVEGAGGAADFAGTERAGFYTVRRGDRESVFALNLGSVRESDIAPKAELRGLAGETVAGRTEMTSGSREIWPWLAMAAFVLLVVEWYVYHRRIA